MISQNHIPDELKVEFAEDRGKILKLIDRLKEEDEMFTYNNPTIEEVLRGGRSNYSIVNKLRRRYDCDEFHFHGFYFSAGLVMRKCARVNDIVQFRKNYILPCVSLTEGVKGVVTALDEDSQITVLFADGVKACLPDSEVLVFGRRGRWYRKEKSYPPTQGDLFKIAKDDLVQYVPTKEYQFFVTNYRVLAGTRGKVVDRVGDISFRLGLPTVPSIKTTGGLTYQNLELVRKNNVDFEKVYREVFA